jgi:sugar phosphate isomerase/epimerase
MEADHPSACILPDVYHLHRGGSRFGGVKLLAPRAIHVFHFNDYPADPPREKLTDAHRVYPGDGVAPLKALLRDLDEGGFRVMLSLELFNRQYWAQDPLAVASAGFEKMNALVQGVTKS